MAAGRKKSGKAPPPRTRRRAVVRAKDGALDLKRQLAEAHEQRTANAEILKVIASSPSDVQPVFDAIVETAKRLIGAFSATVTHVGG